MSVKYEKRQLQGGYNSNVSASRFSCAIFLIFFAEGLNKNFYKVQSSQEVSKGQHSTNPSPIDAAVNKIACDISSKQKSSSQRHFVKMLTVSYGAAWSG